MAHPASTPSISVMNVTWQLNVAICFLSCGLFLPIAAVNCEFWMCKYHLGQCFLFISLLYVHVY